MCSSDLPAPVADSVPPEPTSKVPELAAVPLRFNDQLFNFAVFPCWVSATNRLQVLFQLPFNPESPALICPALYATPAAKGFTPSRPSAA